MARHVRAPLAASLACAGGLVALAFLVYGADLFQRLDAAVLTRLIAEPGSHAEALAATLARLADPPALLAMLALACGIALAQARPRGAVAAILVVAGANLTTQALKVALAHPRFQSALGADQISWNSFPSGHVTAAASAVVAFALVVPPSLRPAVAVLGASLVTAVGCSVLVLSWHYPSDVLGGILVAAGWGFAVLAGLRALESGLPGRPGQLARRPAISVK